MPENRVLPPTPLPNTYWVIPGRLLAGEYPGGNSQLETQGRLAKLLEAGIRCFIDLTHPDELEPYDAELPLEIEYIRKPIKDHGLPARRDHMIEIQACIAHAMRMGVPAYIHCRAGIGRTGMTVACFLVEQGLAGDAALDELNRLWQQCYRASSWPYVPETEDQCDYVRSWIPQVDTLLRERVAAAPVRERAAAPEREREDPLMERSTLDAAKVLRDRFQGALVGLAVCDALAASTQFRKPGSFTPVGDLLGGGPFDLPRGAWSDDTSMALCFAESLLESNGFDPRDQVERYRQWQQHGHLSATGQALGISAGTAKALAQAGWRRQMFSGAHDPKLLDPEVLSRVAPAAMFYFAQPADAVTFGSEASRTTCQSPSCIEACKVLAASVHAALSGKPKSEVLAPGAELLDPETLKTAVARVAAAPGTTSAPRAGNVIDSLEAALWAFRTTSSFRDGALKAVNLGGNSDVAGAVYGQLAGAHYGVGAIPATWRTSLMEKDLVEGLADRLLAHAMVGLAG